MHLRDICTTVQTLFTVFITIQDLHVKTYMDLIISVLTWRPGPPCASRKVFTWLQGESGSGSAKTSLKFTLELFLLEGALVFL